MEGCGDLITNGVNDQEIPMDLRPCITLFVIPNISLLISVSRNIHKANKGGKSVTIGPDDLTSVVGNTWTTGHGSVFRAKNIQTDK